MNSPASPQSSPSDFRHQSPDLKSSSSLGWGLVLFVLLLQFWSRYMPSPWAVFVADDWANWARSSFYSSHLNALLTGLQDPNRPLSMAAVEVLYRIFGNRPVYWTMLSLAGNSLLLLFLVRMAWGLTGRRTVTLLTGVLFALFPNLTETYHWSTQVLNEVACALVFYALSGWMWVDYVRHGGGWRLAISSLAYMAALFSYEAGILVPAAYIFLLSWRTAPVKSLFRLSPFGVVLLTYAAWRITDAFGLNQSWHYPPHMEAGLSMGGISWNIRQVIQWWAGDNLFGSVLHGLQSFSTLSLWTRRWLIVCNVFIISMIGLFLHRTQRKDTASQPPFTATQVVLFVMCWIATTFAISILSYAAPRLNVLPAMGISLLLALVLVRLNLRTWGLVLFIPAVLAMTSNQGTSESYRQAGELNARLYAYLQNTVEDWRDKDVLLLDTESIRHRLTPGLISTVGSGQATWAEYRNALLLRGFVTRGMVQLALQERDPSLLILHDMENGTQIEGEVLQWHERYNPLLPRSTPVNRVYVVDAGSVAWGKQ